MGSKTFLTINRGESYAVHVSVIKNSDTKWKSSLTAAGQEDFGSATALAIISVEEMIKALVISLDGKGFMFRGVPGFDTLFKNHQIRYFLAYTMFVVWVFGEDIKALFAKFSNKPEAFIEFSMKLFSNDPEINRQIELYSIGKFAQMKNRI